MLVSVLSPRGQKGANSQDTATKADSVLATRLAAGSTVVLGVVKDLRNGETSQVESLSKGKLKPALQVPAQLSHDGGLAGGHLVWAVGGVVLKAGQSDLKIWNV